MSYKTRRGFNNGNTLRRCPRRYLTCESYNDGEWSVTDRRNPKSQTAILVGPDKLPAQPGISYSMKKRRGWEVAEWIEAAIADGDFENDAVEMVQGHRSIPMERRSRTQRVTRKAAMAGAPLRELTRRRGYINTESALTMLRADEEKEKEEEEEKQPKRRRRKRNNRQKEEEEEKGWVIGSSEQAKQHQKRPDRRDLLFTIDEATVPNNALVRSASCPWARHCRPRRPFVALDMGIEEDLQAAQDAAEQSFFEEEEEETLEVREPAAHSVMDFLFSAVLRCPPERRSNTRASPPTAPNDRKGRQVAVEVPPASPVPEAALDLEDRLEMVPLTVQLPALQLRPPALSARFGPRYREATSAPRAFGVALSEAPLDAVGGPAVLVFVPRSSSSSGFTSCDVILNAEAEGRTRIFALPPGEVHQPFSDVAAFVARCEEFAASCGLASAPRPPNELPCVSRAATLLARPIAIAASDEAVSSGSAPCDTATDCLCEDMEVAGSCDVCFDLVSTGDNGCAQHQCGHIFCDTCWRHHLIATIRQGRGRLLCPAADCSATVDVITALRFVSLGLMRQFLRKQEENRLRLSRSVVWCPRQHCARSICVHVSKDGSSKRPQEVICTCGHYFCISCKEEVHWPASCKAYRTYKAKMKTLGDWNKNDLDTPVVRMQVSACPGCGEFIEKTQGCFYVQCACGVGFCWDCGKPASHYDHRCDPLVKNSRQKVNFVGEVFTPTGIRSNIYCSSVRSRLFRQTVSNAHLNKKKLRFLLLQVSKESDHMTLLRVRQEVSSVIRNYKELLRLIEFAYVASMSLHKSMRYEKHQLKLLAESLQSLTTLIQAVINWTPLHARKSRAQLLRAYFEQAQRAVRWLSAYRGVLTDEKTLRLQF